MKAILRKGSYLYMGSDKIELAEDALFNFPKIFSIDALAEFLAGNAANYGVNLPGLAQDEEITDEKGEVRTVRVTYGVGGSRIVTEMDEVEDFEAIQKANVAEANSKAEESKAEQKAAIEQSRTEANNRVSSMATEKLVQDAGRTPTRRDEIIPTIRDSRTGEILQETDENVLRERLIHEMTIAPRQFASSGEITPGFENAFPKPPTTPGLETASVAEPLAPFTTDNPNPAAMTMASLPTNPPEGIDLCDDIPPEFPARNELAKNGINTFTRLREVNQDRKGLEGLKGINPTRAALIREALANRGEV